MSKGSEMTGPIRVAVATAEDALSAALSAYLRRRPEVEVVAAPHPSEESHLAPGGGSRFDAMVLDLRIPHAIERLPQLSLTAPVLVLGPSEPNTMIDAFDAGAASYIDDDASFQEISDAIQHLVRGHAVVPPPLLGALLNHVIVRRRSERAARQQLELLTAREREVFELVAQGVDNAGIADRLYISPATARTHVQRVFQKLELHSRAEVIAFAIRCGIYPDGAR